MLEDSQIIFSFPRLAGGLYGMEEESHLISHSGPKIPSLHSQLPEPQKKCKIMAFGAVFKDLGLLFYLLLGPR